ncbi:hypothetical protein G7009_25590 [Pseudomonas capeferrum]|uniref:hypothetical protein n=1 Tax=Pseudomonas capeferrum TaxID=1495066 RepID=UPI0015E3891B|nr:hypothetical protein [Pseudomonas capeferrum]MBA1205090.1 hypothetical protein [Pseudomonas capeferrum]
MGISDQCSAAEYSWQLSDAEIIGSRMPHDERPDPQWVIEQCQSAIFFWRLLAPVITASQKRNTFRAPPFLPPDIRGYAPEAAD